ncbi:hypothetical protein J6590_085300 [Homalodisca vitripennis]|nr:hypothetical protein J6590_085300 [Homalodisca vitripennis]
MSEKVGRGVSGCVKGKLRIVTGFEERTSLERNHHENKGVSDCGRTRSSPTEATIHTLTSTRLWSDRGRTMSSPTILTRQF